MSAKATKAGKEPTEKEGLGAAAKPPKAAKAGGGGRERSVNSKRLRPGQLDGLVLSFMRKHENDLPMSPTTIAKGIKRSSGAVGNCLERLAKDRKARLVNKAPREYDLKGVSSR
jgi:hypothetical protein